MALGYLDPAPKELVKSPRKQVGGLVVSTPCL